LVVNGCVLFDRNPILVITVYRVHGKVPIYILYIGKGGGTPVGICHLYRGVALGIIKVQISVQNTSLPVKIILIVVQRRVIARIVGVNGSFIGIVLAIIAQIL